MPEIATPELEQVVGLTEIARGGGNSAGPYSSAMKDLKLPSGKGENKKYWTFFVPAPINAELSTPEEIEKDARDKCRKLSNSFAGIARRITKADANYKFAFRTVPKNPDEAGSPLGVRVYRIDA